MNSKEAALKLHDALLECDEIKEYRRYESAIRKHGEIAALEKELKAMQKQLILAKAKEEDYDALLADYQRKKQAFMTHPLVVNYLNAKEDANDLLLEVEAMINNGISF